MKKLIILTILVIIILGIGCTSIVTLTQVEDKWGPPTEIKHRDNLIIYYYYFYKGYVKGTVVGAGPVTTGSAQLTENWLILEVIADSTGKVLKYRKYWKQPETRPSG